MFGRKNAQPQPTTQQTSPAFSSKSNQSQTISPQNNAANANSIKAMAPQGVPMATSQTPLPPPPPALKFQGGATVNQINLHNSGVTAQKPLPIILPRDTFIPTSSAINSQSNKDTVQKIAAPSDMSKYTNKVKTNLFLSRNY